MADEDSKIVIPVEIDDSQARAQIEQLSETMQRTIAKQSERAGISPEEFYRRGEALKESIRNYQDKQQTKEERGGSKSPPNLEQEVFDETNKEVGRSAEAVRLFREALHALHPAFGEAGISITEMTGFVRAATGGVVALSAAISGYLITALEKAGDESNAAANRLSTFAPGGPKPSYGTEQLGGLRSLGRDLGEFPTELANPYEQLLRINQNQPPGQQRPDSDLREVLGTLVKGLQSERVDPEKGIGAITELLKSVRERGFVTGESLKAFQELGPRTAGAIVQELNKARPGAASYSDREFLSATRAASGQINLNQQQAEAAAPDSISDAWHRVKVAADRLSEVSQGGHVVAGALDGFADFLDLIGKSAGKIKEHAPGLGAAVSGSARAALLGPLDVIPQVLTRRSEGESGTGQQQERLNDAFDKTAPVASNSGVAGASDQLREAFLELHPAVKGVQDVLEDFAQKSKELSYVAADASKKQAALNLKYEPAETESKLQKDQIAVANADLHIENAKINAQEAQKNKELSELAPAEAHDRTQSAYTQYRQALAKFRGEDAYVDPNADLHSLQAARHNYERSQIEEKYSYLEPKKAELAAERAQTDIRSAEIEKRDASLKLAKDSSGAPISHELAQLRYAQAALDFDKVKVELLEKILQALSKNDQKANEDVDKLGASSSERARGYSVEDFNNRYGGAPSRRIGSDESRLVSRDPNLHTVEGDRAERLGRTPPPSKESREPESYTPSTKEDFRSDLDNSIDDLKKDWKSQRELNAQLHRQGTVASPQARTPAGVSQVNPPAVRGHYDENYNFVPDVPTYSGLGRGSIAGPGAAGASIPASNDYEFSGRKNPAGPYQEGISSPITFPKYNQQQLDSLPSEYPNGVPLPQPRPPEANKQSSTDATQQIATLGETLREALSGLSSKLNPPQTTPDDSPTTGGIRGEAPASGDESTSQVSGLGEAADAAKSSLSDFASVVKSLSAMAAAGADDGSTVSVATGGYIRGPGTTTSDSINAKLSDKEFVHPADATEYYGLPFMEAIRTKQLPKFATGGLFSGMLGGMRSGVAASAPSHGSAPGTSASAPAAAASKMEHWGTVDWRTDHGTHRVATERDTMRHLSSSAKSAKRYSTGSKPGWYGGNP